MSGEESGISYFHRPRTITTVRAEIYCIDSVSRTYTIRIAEFFEYFQCIYLMYFNGKRATLLRIRMTEQKFRNNRILENPRQLKYVP